MNGLQGNSCIFSIDVASGIQKSGIILENNVQPPNLKLSLLKVVHLPVKIKLICIPKSETPLPPDNKMNT